MATCFLPILGKRLRVTTLDRCGAPLAPAEEDGFIATDGFISATLTTEVEEGTEIITKKADGSLCVNERLASGFKRFTVALTFCDVNPALLSFVSSAKPYMDAGGEISGFTMGEGPIDKKFALELWTGLSNVPCDDGGDEASGYLLLPFVNAGTLGDIAITGDAAVTFSLANAYTMGGTPWGVGPYLVVAGAGTTPAALPTALDPLDHLLLMDTAVAPPPSACEAKPMPAAIGD